MIIVSNTSPISNLLVIEKLYLLKDLFDEIVIPEKVREEVLRLKESSVDLIPFLKAEWIKTHKVTDQLLVQQLIEDVDLGEAEAIALYKELQADRLLIDERKGRKKAESLEINIVGLLGCVAQAKKLGLIINVKEILDQLINEAGFRISTALYHKILYECNEDS